MSFIEYLKVSVYGCIGIAAAIFATLAYSLAKMTVLVGIAFINVYTYGKKVDKHTGK